MDIKKLLTYALIGVGAFFLITQPTQASALVTFVLTLGGH